ncbi:FimV/HubP family polar landmark protein [Pseudomonas sp. dw_358]|uniref:FimV/HubP family polar landmark protein n=1 Tax=Pseudomonas sp. dw_358 TaxID=2720083 RepID=UPI001BD3AFC5|nr:FimV/HubP family polar landmark protein [Pseudomonas sp. dw_358]
MLERLLSRSRRFPQALLPLALAFGALCYSSISSALGLGELTLRSYLNQPFKADIDLTDTAGLDADDISAAIATPDAYAKAGIDRIFFLNDLRFTPDFSGGRKVIHVTSNKALTEPYLNFLVEVNRPGGQLLRAYTVLLDPPGTVALAPPPPVVASKPAARPAAKPKAAAAPDAEHASAPPAPPAPPMAPAVDPQVQKSLDELRLRLQTLQSEVDVKNSQVASLQAQLAQTKGVPAEPAASVSAPVLVNSAPASGPAPVATNPVPAASPAAVPAAPVAATPAPASTPAPAPAPINKPAAVTPAPIIPAPVSEEDSSWYLMLGVAALVLLLVALLLVVRRNRLRSASLAVVPLEAESEDSALVKPAQASEAQVAAPVTRSLAQQEPVAASRRETAAATDALDGASIYIAYGRFNEALGILREGVIKQPDRTDLRLRILEVMGQQGDLAGFDQEEAEMLAIGFSAEKIQQVRQQSPKLAQAAKAAAAPSVSPEPAAVVAAAGLAAATAVAAQAEVKASPVTAPSEPAPEITALHTSPVAEPDFDFDLESLGGEDLPLLDDSVPTQEPAQEFQLNLDDLSTDVDWDAVSPFEPAPMVRKAAPAEPAELDLDEPLEVDPIFNTNLRELPEVYEMPDEQFLSDFADLDEPLLETEPVNEHDLQSQDDIDNDFLSSFGADSDFELEALSVDFDSVESQQASAEKLEQAQSLIEIGDTDGASNLLHELLRDGDDSCKASARVLLAGL